MHQQNREHYMHTRACNTHKHLKWSPKFWGVKCQINSGHLEDIFSEICFHSVSCLLSVFYLLNSGTEMVLCNPSNNWEDKKLIDTLTLCNDHLLTCMSWVPSGWTHKILPDSQWCKVVVIPVSSDGHSIITLTALDMLHLNLISLAKHNILSCPANTAWPIQWERKIWVMIIITGDACLSL